MSCIENLINKSSSYSVDNIKHGYDDIIFSSCNHELMNMLSIKNGFFAFDNALHVFPIGASSSNIDLFRFNHVSGWKSQYWDCCSGALFFAANIFGDLYGIKANKIIGFDPETGTVSKIADNLEGWAEWILSNYEVHVGWPVAHAWQCRNGALEEGCRLMPGKLFCMGGSGALDNLYATPLEEGLKIRGCIASQIRNIPPGTKIFVNTE